MPFTPLSEHRSVTETTLIPRVYYFKWETSKNTHVSIQKKENLEKENRESTVDTDSSTTCSFISQIRARGFTCLPALVKTEGGRMQTKLSCMSAPGCVLVECSEARAWCAAVASSAEGTCPATARMLEKNAGQTCTWSGEETCSYSAGGSGEGN